MVDLAPGSRVTVSNPSVELDVSQPGFVKGFLAVTGPAGPQGPGGTPGGAAGGDLAGTYPNPTIAAKDAAAATPSMRTLGTGAQQAAAGNHTHVAADIASGVIAPARLGTGTPTNTVFLRGDGVWGTPSGGGGSGLLASLSYAPATAVTLSTTNTAALVDVDATNLAITFTAPASGTVIVKLNGYCAQSTVAGFQVWGLRNGSTMVANSNGAITTSSSQLRMTHSARVTGLTASSSYTFKWGFLTTNSSASAQIFAGSNLGSYGPASMEVWSA